MPRRRYDEVFVTRSDGTKQTFVGDAATDIIRYIDRVGCEPKPKTKTLPRRRYDD